MTLDERLHEIWDELYPNDRWISSEFALDFLCGDLKFRRRAHGLLRNETDAIQAHDTLRAIMIDPKMQAMIVPNDVDFYAASCFIDVLCWMLHHDHNDHFERSMGRLHERMRMFGFMLNYRGNV